MLNELKAKSPKFAELVNAHPTLFILIYDYGTGSVELCRLVDNKLVWAVPKKPA